MNYILNFFNKNSDESLLTNNSNSLLNETQHFNENTCIQIDMLTNEKKRAYIPDFVDFTYQDKKYFFKIGIDDETPHKLNGDFYRNIHDTNHFYIQSITSFYFSKDKAKMHIHVYDEKENTLANICFNYNVNNHLKFNNDCICVTNTNFKIYLFLTRNINSDNFYIQKIIYITNNYTY
tara:strand:- start:89 stop:622 length:534 start_codon:yes stop_codon:yes gene_type:complete